MTTITPTIPANKVEELEAYLKAHLRATVAALLEDQEDLTAKAGEISTLVASIDALQQAHQKGYLVDPMDTFSEKVEELNVNVRFPGQ